MVQDEHCFVVGVFKDAEWAKRGIEALVRHKFSVEALTVIAKDTPETAGLIQQTLGVSGHKLNVHGIGSVIAKGPLINVLQGSSEDLAKIGVAGTIRRAGFQAHDGFIFQTLTAQGGVLAAIQSESRGADALAVLHAFGGGNAAIGAWQGRV